MALHLTDLVSTHQRRVSTLYRRLSAISQAHQGGGYVTPTRDTLVRTVVQGIRRAHGTAPDAKAAAVTADVRLMVEACPASLIGTRNRALLLVGLAGAFRRSELVSLDVDDAQFTANGLVVALRRSKTDQEGQGRKVGLPYGSHPVTCPVRSLRAWLEQAGVAHGPIFRYVDRHGNVGPNRLTDQVVALVVKRCAVTAGLDAARYAGHSLRAGLATAAAEADVSERAIMAQTGHKSLPMVPPLYPRGVSVQEERRGRRGAVSFPVGSVRQREASGGATPPAALADRASPGRSVTPPGRQLGEGQSVPNLCAAAYDAEHALKQSTACRLSLPWPAVQACSASADRSLTVDARRGPGGRGVS